MAKDKFTESLNGDKQFIIDALNHEKPFVRGFAIARLIDAKAFDDVFYNIIKNMTNDEGYYALGNSVSYIADLYLNERKKSLVWFN